MEIDPNRLQADIEATAQFGAIETAEGRGRTLLTGTEADEQARDYLVDRLEAAGLSVSVDPVGNIVGRWVPDGADADAAPVAAGSHLDSVPEGGIFDGPLGVYAALESVRAIRESDRQPTRPIDVVSFTEEEGSRFARPLLGSKVAAGRAGVDETLSLTDDDGVSVGAALADIGYRGTDRLDASEWTAWLELHIEQGTRLEAAQIPVGTVSTIAGITHCRADIHGAANHAGTTPMTDRTDALVAAAEFVRDVERIGREAVHSGNETAVATVGRMDVSPNGTNVVPGRVTVDIDIRAATAESIAAMVDRVRESLARIEADRRVDTEFDRYFDVQPTPLSDRCRTAIREAGERTDTATTTLHSGAGHDTMEVARVTDAGLLFAPSRNGISHNPLEWTDWDDCAQATTVLAAALARLAQH